MSLKCPKCGRMNPESTTQCGCGQNLSALARPAASQPPRRCPLCESNNVRLDGWASVETRVQFGTKWMGPGNTGYLVKCFACMDCGYVGHYLDSKDLQTLQSVPISTAMETRSRSGCLGMVLLFLALTVGISIMFGPPLAH